MSILLSLLMSWLSNPQVLAGLGIGAGALFLFLKGRSSGEASIQAEIASAAEALNTQIHKTENTNQQVENKKNEDIQNIDSITNPDDLAKLLTTLSAEKTPSNTSDKK